MERQAMKKQEDKKKGGKPVQHEDNLPTKEAILKNAEKWALTVSILTDDNVRNPFTQMEQSEQAMLMDCNGERVKKDFNFQSELKVVKANGERQKERHHKFSPINYSVLMTAKRNVKANDVANMDRMRSLRMRGVVLDASNMP